MPQVHGRHAHMCVCGGGRWWTGGAHTLLPHTRAPGAGFYVDATEDRWRGNYRMYTYVTAELPALIADELPVDTSNASVTGHSMGGHGALIVGLKNPVRCACRGTSGVI